MLENYSNMVKNNRINVVKGSLSFKWGAISLSTITFFGLRIGYAPWIPTCLSTIYLR
uniref:Uncharacterized protein n=1 Tax=Lepeophtheirus salmonis TaxID=72036 RepID=A0A0K2V8I3_LEPSM